MFTFYIILAAIIAIVAMICCRGDWYYAPSEDQNEETEIKKLKPVSVKKKFHLEDFIEGVILSIMSGILLSVLTLIVAHAIGSCLLPVSEQVAVEKIPVYALQDNLYLGVKKNSSSCEITYLAEEEFGLQVKTLSQYSSDIYFNYVEEGEEPCLEIHQEEFVHGWWDYIVVPAKRSIHLDRRYVFKIPEGSITHDYNIDLQ